MFCDRSTPESDQWNFYVELREQLVAAGMRAERVRFMREAGNDRK